MMAKCKIPEQAVYFGLEARTAGGDWIRIDDEAHGGKWWSCDAADPVELSERVADGAAVDVRAIFAPADRRRTLARSGPWRTGERTIAHEVAAAAPGETPPPAEGTTTSGADSAKTQKEQQQRRKDPARDSGANGRKRHYVQPRIPMAFDAPEGDETLRRFVYLHGLAQATNDRIVAMQQEQTTMIVKMMEVTQAAERERARVQIETTRRHYEALAEGQRQTHAAMLSANKGTEAPLMMQQLGHKTQQIAELVKTMADRIDAIEEADASTALALSDDPNNLERLIQGVASIIGTVANTPLGDRLGDVLAQRADPRHRAAAPQDGAQDVEAAP